jgi:hypothetical protein
MLSVYLSVFRFVYTRCICSLFVCLSVCVCAPLKVPLCGGTLFEENDGENTPFSPRDILVISWRHLGHHILTSHSRRGAYFILTPTKLDIHFPRPAVPLLTIRPFGIRYNLFIFHFSHGVNVIIIMLSRLSVGDVVILWSMLSFFKVSKCYRFRVIIS